MEVRNNLNTTSVGDYSVITKTPTVSRNEQPKSDNKNHSSFISTVLKTVSMGKYPLKMYENKQSNHTSPISGVITIILITIFVIFASINLHQTLIRQNITVNERNLLI